MNRSFRNTSVLLGASLLCGALPLLAADSPPAPAAPDLSLDVYATPAERIDIGGGRITGTEVTAEHPEGISFGMYHADQYVAPEGQYTTVHAVDGTAWYKQYAVDAVDKSPYMAPDGSIAFNESIVKKLPPAPRRKDKI